MIHAPDTDPPTTPEQRAADAWAIWTASHPQDAPPDPDTDTAEDQDCQKLSEPPLLFDIDITDLL